MDVRAFLDSHSKRTIRKVAEKAGTTPDYFLQLAGGHRRASPRLAVRLAKASRGVLSLADLRPDIWGKDLMRDTTT